MSRILVRLRRTARRCLGGALYGMGLAWSLSWFVIYTPFAWFAAGVVMVVSAIAAALCMVFSGE